MDLLTLLVLANFAFTAGSYAFTWQVYRLLSNHERSRVKAHMNEQCGDDCYYCME